MQDLHPSSHKEQYKRMTVARPCSHMGWGSDPGAARLSTMGGRGAAPALPELEVAQTVQPHLEKDGNAMAGLKGPEPRGSLHLGPGQRGAEGVTGDTSAELGSVGRGDGPPVRVVLPSVSPRAGGLWEKVAAASGSSRDAVMR